MSYRRSVMTVEYPHGWQRLAELVKARLAGGNRHHVWIAPDCQAYVRREWPGRCIYTHPDSWLVGVYSALTPQNVIEDDIMARMREIVQGVAA